MFGSLVKIKKALIEELNTLESEGCLFDEQRYQIFKQLKQKYGLIKNTDEKAKLLKKIREEQRCYAIYKMRLLEFANKYSRSKFEQVYVVGLLTNPFNYNKVSIIAPLTSFDFEIEKLSKRLFIKQPFDQYCLKNAKTNDIQFAETMLLSEGKKDIYSEMNEEERAYLFQKASTLRASAFISLNRDDITMENLVSALNFYYGKLQIINKTNTVDLQYLPFTEQLDIVQDLVITCNECLDKKKGQRLNTIVNSYLNSAYKLYDDHNHEEMIS